MKSWLILCLFLPILLNAELNPHLSQLIEHFAKQHHLPGLAAVVIENGTPTFYLRGWSHEQKKFPVTRKTLFEIGSITKVFTTDCLALDILKGEIDLSDPVVDYIPEMQESPHRPFAKITLKQLATHTASLPSLPPSFTKHNKNKNHVLDFIQSWKPGYPIGTKYEYSNLSFGLLGWVLEDFHQKPYFQVIKEEILMPLGMMHTYITLPSAEFPYHALGHYENNTLAPHMGPTPLGAGGALRSTIEDMAKFLLCNMGLAGPENLRQASAFAQKPLFKVNEFMSIGMGWQNVWRNQAYIIDKNGATTGFSSYIGFLPGKQSGVVILANKSRPNVGILGRKILFYLNQPTSYQEKIND